jgi:serine phosphatase RsbU (regulator of sigma subunit)
MRPISTTSASPEESGRTARRRSERLEHELDIARQVQQSLFPSPLPKVSGMRLAAVNQPARIVSGDLYDVIVIDPERVAILCADVSGKGFPAALTPSRSAAVPGLESVTLSRPRRTPAARSALRVTQHRMRPI